MHCIGPACHHPIHFGLVGLDVYNPGYVFITYGVRLQETEWFDCDVYEVMGSVVLASGRSMPEEGDNIQRGEGVVVVLLEPCLQSYAGFGDAQPASSFHWLKFIYVMKKCGQSDWLNAGNPAPAMLDKNQVYPSVLSAAAVHCQRKWAMEVWKNGWCQ